MGNLAPEVNSAKCWSITALIFGIFMCLGVLGANWIVVIGGVFVVISASMPMCCGPKAAGDGACIHLAAMICAIIGALLGLGGGLYAIYWLAVIAPYLGAYMVLLIGPILAAIFGVLGGIF